MEVKLNGPLISSVIRSAILGTQKVLDLHKMDVCQYVFKIVNKKRTRLGQWYYNTFVFPSVLKEGNKVNHLLLKSPNYDVFSEEERKDYFSVACCYVISTEDYNCLEHSVRFVEKELQTYKDILSAIDRNLEVSVPLETWLDILNRSNS